MLEEKTNIKANEVSEIEKIKILLKKEEKLNMIANETGKWKIFIVLCMV